MPELPDIVVYCESIETRVAGKTLRQIDLDSPFLLRTARPPVTDLHERTVQQVTRLGKRVVLEFDGDLYLVIHLMIAGRLHWDAAPANGKPLKKKKGLARLVFDDGALRLTEAGKKRRASFHVVATREALDELHRGGLEVLSASYEEFAKRVTDNNHTLKRILTDPGILSGIGNAYSDEILHRAGLSPMLQSQKVQPDVLRNLYQAIQSVLTEWTARLREEAANTKSGFPEKVTAFRDEMAVHGRFGKPCPVCDAPVQRIVYASNETNYCAKCQTGGVVLKDRALSRLLKASWPSRLED